MKEKAKSVRRKSKVQVGGNQPQPPNNAYVQSHGEWTRVVPQCHPAANFKITHSTLHGYYEVGCADCERYYLRIESPRT